jgi:chromosome transmission fidelity protein 1
LSLLSSTLTWLDDDKHRARKGQIDALTSGDCWCLHSNNAISPYDCLAPEWVISQTRDRLRRELEADEQEYEERLAAARKREEVQRRKFFARSVKRQVYYLLAPCIPLSNRSQRPIPDETASDEDDSFLPDDDDEGLDDSVGHEPW